MAPLCISDSFEKNKFLGLTGQSGIFVNAQLRIDLAALKIIVETSSTSYSKENFLLYNVAVSAYFGQRGQVVPLSTE